MGSSEWEGLLERRLAVLPGSRDPGGGPILLVPLPQDPNLHDVGGISATLKCLKTIPRCVCVCVCVCRGVPKGGIVGCGTPPMAWPVGNFGQFVGKIMLLSANSYICRLIHNFVGKFTILSVNARLCR